MIFAIGECTFCLKIPNTLEFKKCKNGKLYSNCRNCMSRSFGPGVRLVFAKQYKVRKIKLINMEKKEAQELAEKNFIEGGHVWNL
mgnify:FL=1|tara:strand:+ start:1394 stop:1648 length:255 start_codon:yes stop_codon:yes gene_type:complete